MLGEEDLGKTLSALKTTYTIVDFTNLARFEQLGGKGCATGVRPRDEPHKGLFVFKGMDFRTFLAHTDDEDGGDGTIRYLIRCWQHADKLLLRIPPHPNIMPPPTTFVTIRFGNNPPVVCGSLQPFYPGGDVSERLRESKRKGERLPLDLKAHWCANMAAAIAHVHRIAHTYHMDIKPGNFIIDRNSDLVLCDWEQSDAPPTTLAPEADGTWDVAVVGGDGGEAGGENSEDSKKDNPAPSDQAVSRPRLVYTKYQGLPRRNAEEEVGDASWHKWNVFPIWNAECPLALELAEVFSLGRSMWMLLRQPAIAARRDGGGTLLGEGVGGLPV
ncbi:hypothetical protein QBC40DRAFT_274512 [Triangularia verruculosa]|uniref:Protein kinase domain-containing protein n=1 Tax=Triangularia verruculosa TaxID=2587418 RepID=A0AAN6XQI2_9PEZI|nr:hypothetical protein QBC40DRAFT_274512 [Triangularia verruculosa]